MYRLPRAVASLSSTKYWSRADSATPEQSGYSRKCGRLASSCCAGNLSLFETCLVKTRFILPRKEAEMDLDFGFGLKPYALWFSDVTPSANSVVPLERTVFRNALG